MKFVLPSILALASVFFLRWIWSQLRNAPLIEDKVSVCAWCSGYYGKDGIARPDPPAIVADPVSHGICLDCLQEQKAELVKQQIAAALERRGILNK